jgi:hypothetical protein
VFHNETLEEASFLIPTVTEKHFISFIQGRQEECFFRERLTAAFGETQTVGLRFLVW